jgi:hypothetical protein
MDAMRLNSWRERPARGDSGRQGRSLSAGPLIFEVQRSGRGGVSLYVRLALGKRSLSARIESVRWML